MTAEKQEATFTGNRLRVLVSVLDEIVPPSPDGTLPGAGEAGVSTYIQEALRKLPDLSSMIVHGLAELDDAARSRHGQSFADLGRHDKQQLLAEQGFMIPLTLHTYVGYYQTPRVVEALGLQPRPPHPQGYEMEPNDLSLLDPVRGRAKLFRDC